MSDDRILMVCPRCGAEHEDFDGFGVLACDSCGMCSCPDIYAGVCTICGLALLVPSPADKATT